MPPLATVFAGLETCRARFGLEDYLLSQTSLDAVFCRFADLQDSDRSLLADGGPGQGQGQGQGQDGHYDAGDGDVPMLPLACAQQGQGTFDGEGGDDVPMLPFGNDGMFPRPGPSDA